VIGEAAIADLRRLGATVVDPTDIPGVNDIGGPEFTVLLCEFKDDIAAYLSELRNTDMRTLADLIAFNEANAERELRWFGQEIFLRPRPPAAPPTPPTPRPWPPPSAWPRRASTRPLTGRPGRHLQPHRQPALDHRPGQRRPLPARQLDPGGRGRLPQHHRARPASRSASSRSGSTSSAAAGPSRPCIKLAHGYEQGTQHTPSPRFLPDPRE
jgi:hypothetical protein